MNAILHLSLGCIRIWLYPEKASRKLRSLQPDALSTKASILDNGYESFEQALFKSVKSTHILHLPLSFLTNTTLASHSGYWISLIWPTSNNFLVSFLMTSRLSSLKFLLLWCTGWTWGSMVRWWHKKSGLMPSMSKAVYSKASRCRAITSTIWSCASWLRDLPSLNFLPPISLSSTFSVGLGQSTRVTRSPLEVGWLRCTPLSLSLGYSHNTSLLLSGQTWLLLMSPQGRVISSSYASSRLLPLFCLGQVCPKGCCKLKGRWQQGTLC